MRGGRAPAGVARGGGHVLRRAPLPTAEDVAPYYRERKPAVGISTVVAERVTGRRRCETRRSPWSPPGTRRPPLPRGADRKRRSSGGGGEAADRDQGVKGRADPNVQGFYPTTAISIRCTRSSPRRGCSALPTGHSGIGAACRAEASSGRVLEPDVRGRRSRRLPELKIVLATRRPLGRRRRSRSR